MIRKKWVDIRQNYSSDSYSLNVWHGCLQLLRKYLRGWNLRLIGQQRATKINLAKRIEENDIIVETRLLSFQEWEERIQIEKDLESFELMEELHWKQRANKNWVLQGDANTHLFHQYANGRRREKTIPVLDSDYGEIRGQQNLTNHIVDFYKNLFGHNDHCNLSLNEDFWGHEFRVSDSDKLALIKDFTLEEIKGVVFYMKTNSAPGPNGYGVSFLGSIGRLSRMKSSLCSKISKLAFWTLGDSIMG